MRTRSAESTFCALRAAEKVCAANLTGVLQGTAFSDEFVLHYISESEGEHHIVLADAESSVSDKIPAFIARMNANPFRTVSLRTGNSATDIRLQTILREHHRLMESAYL